MYLEEIIWFLSLPLLIYISYRMVLWGLRKLEKKESDSH